jgi:uncharacterized protein YcnI
VLASPAGAHVTVDPTFVEANVPKAVALDVPNERSDPMTGLTLRLPGSVELVEAGAPEGWTVSTRAGRVRWTGGKVGFGLTERFPVTLRARGPAGTIRLHAVQLYDDGATVDWTPMLTVLPAEVKAAPSSHLGRAVVAAAFGLVLVAGSLVVVRRLRRPRRS